MNFSHYPRLISHRGANTLAAENSIKAFEIAAKQGATWLEFDVCLAKDGTPVLFHDDNMKRMTGIDGTIAQHTYSELREIPLLFNGEANTSIASLGQALTFCRDHNIACNIELKPQSEDEAMPLAEAVTDFLEPWQGNCVVSSFSATSLLHFKQCSERPIATLAPHVPDEWQEIIKLLDPVAIHLANDIADWATIRKLRSAGLPIAVWTVNDAARMQELLSWGAAGVFTDDLALYQAGDVRTRTGASFT